MWQAKITLIIYIFTRETNCVSQNESDVIVTYSGHAEANDEPSRQLTDKTIDTKDILPTTTDEYLEEVTEDVVFVPNEKEVVRNFDYPYRDPNVFSIKDLMMPKDESEKVNINTEPPQHSDIIFVSGKNNENVVKPSKSERHEETRRSEKETASTPEPLDCSKLDCNNTLASVCGGKVERNHWRYRLFLNECFYRKVNCNFRFEISRYKLVPPEKCKNIAAHYKEPFSYYSPYRYINKLPKEDDTRRSSSSRRSLSMTINGQSCSHSCPATCPDEYQPECGISSSGQKKVFANHCKLDYNSCTYGIVWYIRPLSECVGGKKADMRENRSFIEWMQRIGIVDNKGRLVLSK